MSWEQSEGEERFGHLGIWNRQLAPQLALQLARQLCKWGASLKANPEARVNGSGGNQMTTTASTTEGWSWGVKVSQGRRDGHKGGFGNGSRVGNIARGGTKEA